KPAAEDAGDLLGAGGFGLRLHQHDAPSRRALAGGCRAPRGPRPQAVSPHGHGVSPLSRALRVDGGAQPRHGAVPTHRRRATTRATAIRTVEMLHASAAPIRPKVGPRIAMSRKRTTRAEATMRG